VEKLKTFLKRKVANSTVTCDLEGYIQLKTQIEKLLSKRIKLNVFNLYSDAVPETVVSFIRGYYIERGSTIYRGKVDIPISHGGFELCFGDKNEREVVVLLPLQTFYEIITIKIL